jgi:hypothetical protein
MTQPWQHKESKKRIALTLALTSPPPLLPFLTPSLTLAHPRLTTHSPSSREHLLARPCLDAVFRRPKSDS